MDARDYLARKGLSGEWDEERPNTLEEKAWARAREAGDHRPRAGTPHDWEDWERFHDELAEGAGEIEQKIDHDAHRQAIEHGADETVQHFTPAAGPRARVDMPADEPASPPRPAPVEPRAALKALAVLLPPLAVGLARGGGQRIALNLLLTLLGWLPGVGHALWWLGRQGAGRVR
ncbi:YqaE/Pmp3 family membrane protein [Halomonas sp. C05BenzN]|uniref:YqaE/Pmp3 family membrane protein n=1 Tax=Halomonas sp. C05BenzN TaxID=3411041 RepID=UPI003B927430